MKKKIFSILIGMGMCFWVEAQSWTQPIYVTTSGSQSGLGNFRATGTGNAGIYFDASNGDLVGSDYGSLLQMNDLSIQLNNYGANPISFRTASTDRMTISGNGNVGIGTSSPSKPLHLQRNGDLFVRLENTATNGSVVFFGPVSSNGLKETQLQYESVFRLYDRTQNTWRMMIDDAGNVGIGTTSPSERLDVNGKIQSDFVRVNAVSSSEGGEIMLDGPSGFNDWRIDNRYGAYRLHHSGSTYFQLNSNGNLGIGTTSPSKKLEVFDGDIRIQRTSGNAQLQLTDNGVRNWYMRVVDGVNRFSITDDATEFLSIDATNANIGIGTTSPDEKLAVKGTIHAEEVKVDLNVPGPDYVFEPDYNLLSLEEIEAFIKSEKHLPEIPSAKEMEANGVMLGEMNMLLLKKIEELTLHVIELNKINMQHKKLLDHQSKLIEDLKNKIEE